MPGGYDTRGAIGMMAQTAKDIQFKWIGDYRAQPYVRVPQLHEPPRVKLARVGIR